MSTNRFGAEMTRERLEPFLDMNPERGYDEQLRAAADADVPADTYETDSETN